MDAQCSCDSTKTIGEVRGVVEQEINELELGLPLAAVAMDGGTGAGSEAHEWAR